LSKTKSKSKSKPSRGVQQAPAFGASPFGASGEGFGFGFGATKPATGFGTAAGFRSNTFGSPTGAANGAIAAGAFGAGGGGGGFGSAAAASPEKAARARETKAIAGKATRNVVAEQNYTIVRTLIQIRRTKHKDPNRKKDHLGFGFLGHDFFKVLLGPMMKSPKLVRTDADIKVAVLSWYRNRRIEHPRLGQSRYSCCS
jgi:hypothetical protein